MVVGAPSRADVNEMRLLPRHHRPRATSRSGLRIAAPKRCLASETAALDTAPRMSFRRTDSDGLMPTTAGHACGSGHLILISLSNSSLLSDRSMTERIGARSDPDCLDAIRVDEIAGNALIGLSTVETAEQFT